MKGNFVITTSWDDGHYLDLRLASLLEKYGLKGTFYICRDYMAENRISESQITALSRRHEIGAHTLTHPLLTHINIENAQHEITGSREWLNGITGQAVTAFCYPRGDHNATVQQLVKDAGFQVARTVTPYSVEIETNPLVMPTTIQVYPFPLRPVDSYRARFEPIQRVLPHIRRLKLPISSLRNWCALAVALLRRAATVGGVWHLWGHSWEIERYNMWDDLESVLAVIHSFPKARILTNTELAQVSSEHHSNILQYP